MAAAIVDEKEAVAEILAATIDSNVENLNRRPAQTLQILAREKIVEMALIAVNRIHTGLRNSWLGWPLQFLPNLPNLEPKVPLIHQINRIKTASTYCHKTKLSKTIR